MVTIRGGGELLLNHGSKNAQSPNKLESLFIWIVIASTDVFLFEEHALRLRENGF